MYKILYFYIYYKVDLFYLLNTEFNMNTKIIIICSEDQSQIMSEIRNRLMQADSDLSAINSFTTDVSAPKNKDASLCYKYYIPYTEVMSAFTNCSCVWCTTDKSNEEITSGVMSEDWYNNDIMCCSFYEFTCVYSSYLKNADDILCVWCETGYSSKQERIYAEYVMFRIELFELPFMYFNIKRGKESVTDAVNTVLKYITCETEEERADLIEQNS